MPRLFRLTLLCGVLAALGAPPVHADDQRTLNQPETLTTAHFWVHYSGLHEDEHRINVVQAHDIAAWAERAYDAYRSWGYAAPLDDGDGHLDFYVENMQDDFDTNTWGGAWSDNPAALTSSAYAKLEPKNGLDEHKVAHLVFHFFQAATWNQLDPWLRESAAEWASFRLLGFPTSVFAFEQGENVPLTDFTQATAIPLDCSYGAIPGELEDTGGGEHCGDVPPEQNSYQAWPFLTYLGERFGTQIIKEIHDRGPAIGDPNAASLDFLTQVLTTKGASLADVFNDSTVAAMTGKYTAPGLKDTSPVTWTTIATGDTAGPLAPVKIPVNHLSVRYVGVQRGGAGTGPCYAATLTLTVAIPSGVASRPHFLWPAPESTPIPLAITGSNATLSVPWDTCTWKTEGLLSLPNDSRAIDGTEFTVSGSLVVDKTTIATATPPPTPSYTGPTVAVPETEVAPAIALYGPETLRISKRQRAVRLVVFSSGQGRLEAQLGATALGTRDLRAGNNDLRFTLQKGFARVLAARDVLTVTSLSSSGTRGATVSRKLVFTK
jgi:hypothetical protein